MRGPRAAVLLAVAAALAIAGPAGNAQTALSTRVIVFNGENNRLNAYDGATGAMQTVIPSAQDLPPAGPGDRTRGLDINGQICFDTRHPHRFIAGEDTFQPNPLQGWGYFELHGDTVGAMSATQLGKLTPTYQTTPDNAENYGCGFLSDGRLVTGDIGNQQPFTPPTGQLIVWFPPFDSFDVRFCKIDVAIPTASGIYVDEQDRVHIAAARPGAPFTADSAGVYRYTGPFPTSADAGGGCGRKDGTGAPLADANRIGKSLFISATPSGAVTPSAIVRTADGGFYVSSVFSGVIAQYNSSGAFVRRVLEPAAGDLVPPYRTGTPYGLGIDSAGALYYADLGVVLGPPPGPGDRNGTVRRIRFAGGNPQAPEVLGSRLAFPDGIGILEVPAAGAAAAAPDERPPVAPRPLPATGALPVAVASALVAMAATAIALRRRSAR